MYEQLVAIFSSMDIIGTVSNKIDLLSGIIEGYLSGANNLRLVSIILMILALILFLFLIIIIYVKTIVTFLKNEPNAQHVSNDVECSDEESQIIDRDEERDLELERELQKELDMARAAHNQHIQEQAQKDREQEKKRKNKENIRAENKEKSLKDYKKSPEISLDWKKGTPPPAYENMQIADINLSYHQTNKSLNELLGLIIDMLGRGVDDLKIAQTVMFRNQNVDSEEDVLQMIEAIKRFVDLCRSNAFTKLANNGNLPSEEEALYHLAKGDPSLALTLLEKLMDKDIERAAKTSVESQKTTLYKSVSEKACIFGTLSSANDVMLATGAFELSIELTPNNSNAWSRVGDMYMKAGSQNKAFWAYQNAVNFADEEINVRELANANKHLSQHLYDQGNSLQAAKLYNSSKQYYDSLGINRRLDKQEIEIVEIIEANRNEDLQRTIHNLLHSSNIQKH